MSWRAGLAVLALSAGASAHPRVQLTLDPCAEATSAEVRRLLAIDLGALLVDDPTPRADDTRASISCEGALIQLRVDDPLTKKALTRLVDISGSPANAHARLLALAMSELITASWTELETNPEPAVPPVGPPSSPEARHSALVAVEKHLPQVTALPRLRVVALAAGQTFFNRLGFLFGGGLRVGQDRRRGFAWEIDLLEQHGSGTATLGAVTVDTLSFGPVLSYQHTFRRVVLRIGGGVRGGLARLSGQPGRADVHGATAWGGWLGPMAAASLTAVPTRRLALEFSLEGGYVAAPFGGLVDGARQVAVDGPWLGVQLGLGVFP